MLFQQKPLYADFMQIDRSMRVFVLGFASILITAQGQTNTQSTTSSFTTTTRSKLLGLNLPAPATTPSAQQQPADLVSTGKIIEAVNKTARSVTGRNCAQFELLFWPEQAKLSFQEIFNQFFTNAQKAGWQIREAKLASVNTDGLTDILDLRFHLLTRRNSSDFAVQTVLFSDQLEIRLCQLKPRT